MAKESSTTPCFKFGDEVVLRDPMSRIQGNNIGTVKKLQVEPPGVIVEWKVPGRIITSFYSPEDIKRVYLKQMLFDFMSEN